MRGLRLSAFAVVMMLYLAYPYFMIHSQERVLKRGEVFRFELLPVDPVDAFRGRYLELNYDGSALPAPPGVQAGDRIYIAIREGGQGFARFTEALPDPPGAGAYLSTRVISISGDLLYFDIPDNMRHYYLNEKTAPLAEEAYNRLVLRSTETEKVAAYAQTRVLKGRVLIEALYFDGKPLPEYLEGQAGSSQ